MDPQDERFDAKVTVLIENVRHHVKEEEQEHFPKVRDELGRNALEDLGDAMVSAKAVAPTHPHPRSPDSPPANLLVGTAAGVVDRVTDTANGIAQGGVTALGDLIATVLRRKKPRVAPTGSKSTRATATKVREAAADATEAVLEAAQEAKSTAARTARSASRGASRTTRAAKSGAKATATSARKSSKRTVSTAKRGATTTGRTARKAPRQPPQRAVVNRQAHRVNRQAHRVNRQAHRVNRQAPALTEGVPELRSVTSSSQSANRRL